MRRPSPARSRASVIPAAPPPTMQMSPPTTAFCDSDRPSTNIPAGAPCPAVTSAAPGSPRRRIWSAATTSLYRNWPAPAREYPLGCDTSLSVHIVLAKIGQSIVQRVMAASSLFRPDVSWWVAATFAGLLAIVPLFLVDVPPLEDYPNHLARAYVLLFGAQDPFLSRMYEPSWHVVPNLGMDLIVPPFLRVLPLHVVGRAFLGLVLLLQFVATLALHRAI